MVISSKDDLINLYFDLYTRDNIISQLVEKIRNNKYLKILDVGGRNGHLDEFLSEDNYYILDILNPESDGKSFYIKGDSKRIPFKNGFFDIVISSDMYEHLTPRDRENALDEMFRVSKNFVIIGAPFYSKEIENAEYYANEYYFRITGQPNPWLKEHIENILPSIEDFECILSNNGYKFLKIGNNNVSNWLLMILLIFYASRHEVPIDQMQAVNNYYNINFMDLGDGQEPTYRKIYLIAKKGFLPEINFYNNTKCDPIKLQELKILIFDAIRGCAEYKDNLIFALNSNQDQATKPVAKLDQDLADRNSEISKLISILDQATKHVAKQDQDLADRDNEISMLTSGIELATKRAAKQDQDLADRDNEISMLTSSIELATKRAAKQDQDLADRDNEISMLTSSIELATKRAAKQDHDLADRDNEISMLTSSIELATKRAAKLDHYLADRDNEISMLTSSIELATKRAAKPDQDLANRDNRISILTSELYQVRESSKMLNNEIREMKRSILWQMTRRFDNIFLERMCPQGTQRRKAYDLGLKGARILANEGCHTLWREYKKRGEFKKSLSKGSEGLKPMNELYNTNNELESILEYYHETKNHISLSKGHDIAVDIIICIHNALEDVITCLEWLIRYTPTPYSLILVDDGSDTPTKAYLEEFSKIYGAYLIRNEIAKGYTLAANQGVRYSKANYIILLNSDTIVTPEWLDRLMECSESDERVGVVGPLSNCASWQSVPEIQEGDDWATNPLPNNVSVEEMGRLIAKYSARSYPRISFLNGFCLLIKRSLINDIGYFDEDVFGRGFGEENDYCIRARKHQWDLVVADDVYVYHAQSRSYSNEKRLALRQYADEALRMKHDINIIIKGVLDCKNNRTLGGIRARTKALFIRKKLVSDAKKLYEGKRILIILPVLDPGGGSYVIIQESKSMIEMGVDVRLFNLKQHEKIFESSFPDLDIPIVYGQIEDIARISQKFDAIIATTNTSVSWVEPISKNGTTILGYYIQDFEPNFYSEGSLEFEKAWLSYTRIPKIVRITKTNWNKDIIKEKIGVNCKIVGPSVDIDLFRPRPRFRSENENVSINIAAMIRPSTPRRNPQQTIEILREIKLRYKDRVNIILFGCSSEELKSLNFINDFVYSQAGILSRDDLAFLFNEIDIFLDCSLFQAMGLTAFEAMACGAAVIVPENGGCNEVVKHEANGLVVDSVSKDACLKALDRLIIDDKLRMEIGSQAIRDMGQIPPEKAAYNILREIFGST